DAAVAAGFVLQVVEPHQNGPGGEVPMVLYSAERRQVLVVDGQGPAPAAASVARLRALGLELVPGNGLLPACVPGACGDWLPPLAATWRRLLAEAEAASGERDGQIEPARAAFYQGFVAEAIDRFAAGAAVRDASGRRHRGLLRGDDLARWRAGWKQPATLDYH